MGRTLNFVGLFLPTVWIYAKICVSASHDLTTLTLNVCPGPTVPVVLCSTSSCWCQTSTAPLQCGRISN